MDSSRNECHIAHSDPCSICGEPIRRREWHSHEFSKRGGPSHLCSECLPCIYEASRLVLECIAAAGLHYRSADELRDLLGSGRVGVLIQGPLSI
jgi:hypothetical protein